MKRWMRYEHLVMPLKLWHSNQRNFPKFQKYSKESKGFEFSKISSYIWPPHLFGFKSVSVGEQLRPIGYVYFLYIFIYSGLEFTLTFLTQAKFKYVVVYLIHCQIL